MKLEALLKRREALKKAIRENAVAISAAQQTVALKALKKSGLLASSPDELAAILARAKSAPETPQP